MAEDQLRAALNVMRRMPPSLTDTSLDGLVNLCPDLTDELLQRVDQPLKTAVDPQSGRAFILCDYNRDGDSYRSPWSNQYVPALSDGFKPTSAIRKIEEQANGVFDKYRKLYFEDENSVSSVYCWDLDGENFAACWLIRKDVENVRGLSEGAWNSIHVLEASQTKGSNWEYKITTTVIVSMKVDNEEVGLVDLSGSMTSQATKEGKVDNAEHTHVSNMGTMVEDTELEIRQAIEGIYIQKTKEVINGMRNPDGPRPAQLKMGGLDELSARIAGRRDSDSD